MKTIKAIHIAVFLLLAAAVLISCASEEEARRPTEDVIIAGEAFKLIEQMRLAYVGKDFDAFGQYCADGTCADVLRNIRKFESVELEFTPGWVDIARDDTVDVDVEWSGLWVVDGDKVQREGKAVFVLGGKPLKLREIRRGSPFSQPQGTGAP